MPRAGLTRTSVTATGAALADDAGWEALTLTALAQQLGVRQPSLYKHIDGMAALRREIRLLVLRELHAELSAAAVGRSGEDALVAMADAYRSYAHRHPGRYSATVAAPPDDDAELQAAANDMLRTIAAVLAGYGLHSDDAVHAIRGLRALLHGFVSLELAGGFALPQDLDESFRRLVHGFGDSLEAIH